MWAMKGERPIALHKRAYQWIYAFHFVQPTTGRSHWLLMPTVNIEVMSLALESWVKEVDPQGRKLLVLLVDQAGWHQSKKLRVPDNVILYPLPPYTPELQPVEATWPLLREVVANRFFTSMAPFQKKLVQRCRYFIDNPSILKARTNWNWLRLVDNAAYSV
jgi:hypothetical protein